MARGQRWRAIEAGLERLLEAPQNAMGKLRDWLERCERRSRPVAALSSQDDGVTAAVLSPLHPLNPISPLNPANPSWSDSKPVEPDATTLPYGPHNDPAARHDAEGAEHTHDTGGTGHHQGASQALVVPAVPEAASHSDNRCSPTRLSSTIFAPGGCWRSRCR